MKKKTIILLTIILCFALIGCGKKNNKKAFEVSKNAYDDINAAYDILETISTDIYEAWRVGIHDKDEILSDGNNYLSSKIHLNKADLENGAAYHVLIKVDHKDPSEWNTISEEDKSYYRTNSDILYNYFEDDLFSYCVSVVICAYTVNGKMEEVQNALNDAKIQMKALSENYSDYEHYPSLKGYYTATTSLFDFCQNPTGSFEQVKTTINDYNNEIRNYINDLNYIFDE